jgi:ribonuclease Z
MKPIFHSRLLGTPFDDPGLFVKILRERRAFLFDLGSIDLLTPAELLKVSEVFISHTHIDHFIGFDHLLRTLLGREKDLKVFGPPRIISNIEGKLSGYTWNLVEDYKFSIEVIEVHNNNLLSYIFNCWERFRKREKGTVPFDKTLIDDSLLKIETATLDHLIPSLAFSISEKIHINIRKDRLMALGLPVGPWLGDLKRYIREGKPDGFTFIARWKKDGRIEEWEFILGEIKEKIATIAKGQKVSYVVDAIYSEENALKIIDLVAGSDILYCEAAFLERDGDRARERYHLTAKQAGLLAKKAGVKKLIIFHFSPKYFSNPSELYEEAMGEFGGGN